MIKPGFYRMSSESYHASEGVSRSFLHRLLTWSPEHAITPQKETQPLLDGTAFHVGCLEPERFELEYIILPDDCRPGTKDNPNPGMKARKEAFLVKAERNNQTVIDQETIDMIKAMANAMRDHLKDHPDPVVAALLNDGESEKAGYWIDPDCPEILCKLRTDWLKNNGVFVDLKSTTDAREHKFVNSAYANGYDMQAGFYLYGATQITRVEHHDFYFIVVEKEAPYGVMVYKATEEMINHGLTRIARAMAIYKECLESGKWPKYPQEVKELGLPGWVTKGNEITMIID